MIYIMFQPCEPPKIDFAQYPSATLCLEAPAISIAVQLVGPSIRTFDMCVDATATVVCKPLTSAMDMLLMHVSGSFAAHGDARPDNIMVLVEACNVKQMKLIDMDWAGVSGNTFYPVTLNARPILWTAGVGPGQPLQQERDLKLLQLQINPALRGAFNDWRKMFPNGVRVSNTKLDFEVQSTWRQPACSILA